jgi:cell division transport system permease protein
VRLRYVSSELGGGLRRNLTMTVAVVVTVWVSLVLFGVGMLIRSEVNLAKGFWYDKVQVAVFLCNENAASPKCDGKITDRQQKAVEKALHDNPEVSDVFYEDQKAAYNRFKEICKDCATVDIVQPQDLQASFRVQLKDAQQYESVNSAVSGMPGVFSVQDSREILQPLFNGLNGLKWISIGLSAGLLLAAVLQIANTIRLTVFSRRREIGIMRLVGASSMYIQLPFVLETVIAALVGAALACGTLAFAPFVTNWLRSGIQAIPWIGWDETVSTMPLLVVLGVALAVVASVSTLHRYLKV